MLRRLNRYVSCEHKRAAYKHRYANMFWNLARIHYKEQMLSFEIVQVSCRVRNSIASKQWYLQNVGQKPSKDHLPDVHRLFMSSMLCVRLVLAVLASARFVDIFAWFYLMLHDAGSGSVFCSRFWFETAMCVPFYLLTWWSRKTAIYHYYVTTSYNILLMAEFRFVCKDSQEPSYLPRFVSIIETSWLPL